MQPTPEQDDALGLFLAGRSLALEAGAGTGKTTTLQLMGSSARGSGVYVAFNRSIVEEAKRKMPRNVSASTFHSLAFRTVGKQYAHRLGGARLRSHELAAILGVDPFVVHYGSQRKVLQPSFLAGHVMRAIRAFCSSADVEPGPEHVAYIEGIDLPAGDGRRGWSNNRLVADALRPALRRAWADLSRPDGSLPFSHDVYLKLWQLGGPVIPGAFLMVDEAQDVAPVQQAAIEAQVAQGTQTVFVGDSQQSIYCQPVGTMVRVPVAVGGGRGKSGPRYEHREVPIETIAEGSKVVSWSRAATHARRGGLRARGSVVAGVASRPYDGELVRVSVDGRTSRYTPEHHCVVDIGDALDGQHVVYMMRRGSSYRVGRTPWRNPTQHGVNGLVQRAGAEGADAVWVLGVCSTRADAALYEALTQTRFGLPGLCFRTTQAYIIDLDAFWSKLGDNSAAAAACLSSFGLLIDHPLWETGGHRKWSRGAIVTAAANLLPGMRMLAADNAVRDDRKWTTPRSSWTPIGVRREWYTGTVVSLSVDTDHTYVADGIVTHNSWRGAVNAMARVPADDRRFLTQSWRFGQAVADVANLLLGVLDAPLRLTGNPGIASRLAPWPDPRAILCRTNARAVEEMLAALADARRPHLMGGGTEVLAFCRAAADLQSGGRPGHPDLACFTSWAEVQAYVEDDPQGGDLKMLVDLVDRYGSATIAGALERQPTEETADLVISTAHKAKGREWPTVRLASDFPDVADPDQPEATRLAYVAVTRAARVLDCEAAGMVRNLLHPPAPEQEPVGG